MIKLCAKLGWPTRPAEDKDYYIKEKKITKNKAFTIEISKFTHAFYLFGIDFTISFPGVSHAGIRLDLMFLKYGIYLELFDVRHWNYEDWKWEEYE